MELIEIQRAIMSFIGNYAYSRTKPEEYVFDEIIAERLKDTVKLEDRKKEYEALKWAKENPNFDFRTFCPEKISFSKDEVYKGLMKMKAFYEVEEYELLTDDRKPKEGWEF